MKEYKVLFNKGSWEDIISFNTKASSSNEAIENVLNNNPEYSDWNKFAILNENT